jgi:hypothetical protein
LFPRLAVLAGDDDQQSERQWVGGLRPIGAVKAFAGTNSGRCGTDGLVELAKGIEGVRGSDCVNDLARRSSASRSMPLVRGNGDLDSFWF